VKLGTPLLIILVTILALNYVPSRQSAAPGYEKTGMPTIIKDNNLKAE
jgi:hypothetical protein